MLSIIKNKFFENEKHKQSSPKEQNSTYESLNQMRVLWGYISILLESTK
jgi:hypothetical protein